MRTRAGLAGADLAQRRRIAAAPPAFAGALTALWREPAGAATAATATATETAIETTTAAAIAPAAAAALLPALRREMLWWPAPRRDAAMRARVLIDPGGSLLALTRALSADAAQGAPSEAVLLAEGRGAAARRLAARYGLEPAAAPAALRAEALSRIRVSALGPEAVWAALGGVSVEALGAAAERRALADALGAAALTRRLVCRDPWDGGTCTAEAALEALRFFRGAAARRPKPVVTIGLSPWKRRNAAPFLSGPEGAPHHRRDPQAALALARRLDAEIALWGPSRARADALRREGVAVLLLEDGFIRSVGLGVEHERPASLCLARRALHFEADRLSDFREMLRGFRPDAAMRRRAEAFLAMLIDLRMTKYNLSGAGRRRRAADAPPATARERVLVVGQVEGDASLRYGGGYAGGNLALLRAARARRPEAMILYKPHPDVLAGMRRDAASRDAAAALADHIAGDLGALEALDWADSVETMTSQLGFEALLWRKPVICHGAPFYGGLGLTTDLSPREDAFECDLIRLVAAAFLEYPLYAAPGLAAPCPPERTVLELAARRHAPRPLGERLWNRAVARILKLLP
ncbi:MAG: hypothetical protein AAGM38_01310 [Pseudomonadota bacterium]